MALIGSSSFELMNNTPQSLAGRISIIEMSGLSLREISGDLEWFYRDCIRTYIERDVRKMTNVKDELKFKRFLASVAARSAQMR